MDLLSLFFGLLVGAIAVYIYLDRQLKVLNTEKIHLEVSLDEKIKSYENQIDMINIAREQMSKDFKAVA
ncbi:MAG: DNA recombination protein RmuC, partial [Candidatus Thioglobus sp.]|nr:DNA recombination protein RmuC [Candidatus Thioglobus sp.]MBT6021777.1 DNA recombination protein RmuC [Candidatus Thioglobus sp.]